MQNTDLHCFKYNATGGNYWDHLRNTNTGVYGWVREDKLKNTVAYAC